MSELNTKSFDETIVNILEGKTRENALAFTARSSIMSAALFWRLPIPIAKHWSA